MANLSISGIRERIFSTTKHEQTTSRSTNPFAQTSFKGNVLSADVFESSKKKDAVPSAQNKLTYSALVGSLGGWSQKLQQARENVIAFGNRMKENISSSWDQMINQDFPTFKNWAASLNTPVNMSFGMNKYATMPVAEIRAELTQSIASLESGQV